jgi:hypothetical protein
MGIELQQARFDEFDSIVSEKGHISEPCPECGGRQFQEDENREILCTNCSFAPFNSYNSLS